MSLFPKCSKCKEPLDGTYHECDIPVGKICPTCFMELPKTGKCDNCD